MWTVLRVTAVKSTVAPRQQRFGRRWKISKRIRYFFASMTKSVEIAGGWNIVVTNCHSTWLRPISKGMILTEYPSDDYYANFECSQPWLTLFLFVGSWLDRPWNFCDSFRRKPMVSLVPIAARFPLVLFVNMHVFSQSYRMSWSLCSK